MGSVKDKPLHFQLLGLYQWDFTQKSHLNILKFLEGGRGSGRFYKVLFCFFFPSLLLGRPRIILDGLFNSWLKCCQPSSTWSPFFSFSQVLSGWLCVLPWPPSLSKCPRFHVSLLSIRFVWLTAYCTSLCMSCKDVSNSACSKRKSPAILFRVPVFLSRQRALLSTELSQLECWI